MSGRIPSSGPRRLPPPGPALFLTLVHHRAPERKNAGPNLLSVGPASETGGIEKLAARRRTPSCDACIIVKSAGLSTPFGYLMFAPLWHPCASPYLPTACPPREGQVHASTTAMAQRACSRQAVRVHRRRGSSDPRGSSVGVFRPRPADLGAPIDAPAFMMGSRQPTPNSAITAGAEGAR